MSWTETLIAGHRADVFEPDRPHPHGFVAVYLHGVHLGRLPGNEVVTAELQRHGLPLVAPHTARSWWTDRICLEFDHHLTAERHLLDNVLPWISQRWGAQPPRIGLWGTSMGGQGALRFGFKHPRTFPIVAAVSPAIDYQNRFHDPDEQTIPTMYDDPEAARQDTATLHVHPLNWPTQIWFCCDPTDERWFDSADRLHNKLTALGIPHQCNLETSAGGHSWSYYNQMVPPALEFVVAALDRERLRFA
jgi:enterochelin esterase-like enzyme